CHLGLATEGTLGRVRGLSDQWVSGTEACPSAAATGPARAEKSASKAASTKLQAPEKHQAPNLNPARRPPSSNSRRRVSQPHSSVESGAESFWDFVLEI